MLLNPLFDSVFRITNIPGLNLPLKVFVYDPILYKELLLAKQSRMAIFVVRCEIYQFHRIFHVC